MVKALLWIQITELLVASSVVFFALYLGCERRIAATFRLQLNYRDRVLKYITHRASAITQLFNRRSNWADLADQTLVGYVDRHSILPGESFQLFLSVPPRKQRVIGSVIVSRLGPKDGSDRTSVFHSHGIIVDHQPIRSSAATTGAPWEAALPPFDTHGWKPGVYVIDFQAEDGSTTPYITSIVVRNPASKGDVLVKIAYNTYQAYNQWGGSSLYDSPLLGVSERGHMVSFDRPLLNNGFHNYHYWEYNLTMWLEQLAEQLHFTVDYSTNFDMSVNASESTGYTLLISSGHDEYWTMEEFRNTERRIKELGGNTLFLGANTAYWQVRYVDINQPKDAPFYGRQMICYKSELDPIRYRCADDANMNITTNFRYKARSPETMLMGVAYSAWGPTKNLYVASTDNPLFTGVGYAPGDLVGPIIGHEWDNRDPENDGNRLYKEGVSANEPIPSSSIQLLFEGTAARTTGEESRAESVYWESDAGAKVFSSGTNFWITALSSLEGEQRARFHAFNRNLILHFLNRELTPTEAQPG